MTSISWHSGLKPPTPARRRTRRLTRKSLSIIYSTSESLNTSNSRLSKADYPRHRSATTYPLKSGAYSIEEIDALCPNMDSSSANIRVLHSETESTSETVLSTKL